jgi:hypothetical protein
LQLLPGHSGRKKELMTAGRTENMSKNPVAHLLRGLFPDKKINHLSKKGGYYVTRKKIQGAI